MRRRCSARLRLPVAVFALLVTHGTAGASGLIQSAVGPGDTATAGATVAEPLSPSGALFANPAGLAAFSETTVSGSLGLGFGRTQVSNDAGYDDTDRIFATIPDQAVSVARRNGWRFGAGFFGSVGMSYDFGADPEAGVPNPFLSECSIAALPLAVAKRVNERLWLGAEVIPTIGYMRNRYNAGDMHVGIKLLGPGIQGLVGATWKPDARWTLGAALRTPGRVWMDGSDSSPGGGRQDVDLEIELPLQLALGVERQLGERLRVVSSLRWTDSSSFGRSMFGFDDAPDFEPAFIEDAADEWRGAVGARYGWNERLELRAGVAYSSRIVGSGGVSPMVFDNHHYSIAGGAGYAIGTWTLELTAGVVPNHGRDVSAQEAGVVPGRYETGGFLVMLGVQRRM